jgi:ABC-type transport system involved in multi-copper enzyme maturation permease subunit
MRLFVADLRKLIRRPASLISILLMVGLLGLIFIAVGATARQAASEPGGAAALLAVTFPGAYTLILSFILGLGGLIAVIYGAAIAGSEWTWGTLKTAVARGESRSRYQLSMFAAIALLVGVGLVIVFIATVITALIGAQLAGVSTSGVSDADAIGRIPEQMGRVWLAVAEQTAVGFAVATLARSQIAGIGAGIGLYIGEQFAALLLGDFVQYLPFNAAGAVVAMTDEAFGGGGGGGQLTARLEPDLALLVVAAWLVGSLAVASLFTERAEISG